MPRVLVIDDSPVTVQLTCQALVEAGYEAESATDLTTLDQRLQTGAFDLVLVDVNMPEMYGDDVVEFLRVQRQLTAKLYLYSDLGEQELASKALAAGADGYITKSSGLEATVEMVRDVLGGKRRILVVDDSDATATLLKSELEAKGHQVATANSAEAATRVILRKKTRPDLVLLDVNMPGVNGEQFCRFIKTNSLFAGIQVVLCSAADEDELKRIVESAGADGYLRKDALIAKEILQLLD